MNAGSSEILAGVMGISGLRQSAVTLTMEVEFTAQADLNVLVISPDKKWMLYVAYPQHHLWRKKDGS